MIVRRISFSHGAICVLLLALSSGCGSAPDAAAAKQHMSSDQLALGEPIVNSVGMVFVPIPAGEFQMGTPKPRDGELQQPEELQHPVTITEPFYLGICEVTQQQYTAVMGTSPWQGQPLVEEGPDYAATYISWDDAVAFCEALSEQEGVRYRLPTEAEWEYACRAGTESAYSFGDDPQALGEHAWHDRNAYAEGEQYPHSVGRKLPNAWGLYDMHGNVWEWCQDWYAPYGSADAVADPTGPETGRFHVWRGGGFSDPAVNVRSATRVSFGRAEYRPGFATGFRVVRTINEFPPSRGAAE